VKRFLIALQFLTIIPVKIKPPIKKEDLGASLLYFPLVGVLIGGVLALCAVVLAPFSALFRAAVILIISVLITGGIHLDGFADTCDAFYGNNPKDKILEIMRDSHIGAMGAAGMVSVLLLKFSIIAGFSEELLWRVLILTAVFSRWSQVLACRGASYAREDGKGRYFMEYATKQALLSGFFFTAALFYLFFKLEGFVLFFASLLPVLLLLQYMKKRIGGMTGDTIGALSEFAEVSILLLAFFMHLAY